MIDDAIAAMTIKVSSLHSDEEINKINKKINPQIAYVILREYYDKLVPHKKTMSISQTTKLVSLLCSTALYFR